jgi:molecular chaperone HtpG
VDSDVIDKLIQKEEQRESKLSADKQEDLKSVFSVKPKNKDIYIVSFENLYENESPVTITQSEFMRRMKDMSQMGGGMNFYGELPDSYNVVVNSNHKIIANIVEELYSARGNELTANDTERKRVREEVDFMEKEHKKRKPEEISQPEKDDLEKLRKELNDIENSRKDILENYGSSNNTVKQLLDLALLANNMLKGEELSSFVKRSVELL